jgi:hypothetical protein
VVVTRKVVLLAAFAFLLPALAMAGSVSFSTSGAFGPGNLPITFAGTSYTNVDASTPGTNLSFGTFSVSQCTTFPACNSPENFTLTIAQSAPTGGGGTLDAIITGIVKFHKNQSNYTITFTKSVVTIGTVVYTIPLGETINFGKNTTSLNGHVLNPSVPEPTANLLLGLGTIALMGFSMVSRKMINT